MKQSSWKVARFVYVEKILTLQNLFVAKKHVLKENSAGTILT